MYRHRDEIARLQQALQQEDTANPAFVTADGLAQRLSKAGRRSSIVILVRENLVWIVEKFEKFRPNRWYSGVFMLMLRLLQTSVLVLVPRQNLQAAAACVLSVLGACVLREAKPFRRGSDNEIAVIAQYCVFVWAFSVVLRDMGISDPKLLVLMGCVLIVVTVAVFAHALWRAHAEMKALHAMQRGSHASSCVASDGDGESLQAIDSGSDAAGGAHDPPSSPSKADAEKEIELTEVAVTATNYGRPRHWHELLCAAPSSSDDAPAVADEVATLRARLAEKDAQLTEKDAELAEKGAEIMRLLASKKEAR